MTKLLEKLGREYSIYLHFKKAKQWKTAHIFKGRCEMLIELLLEDGYVFSQDPTSLDNIILKDIRGF